MTNLDQTLTVAPLLPVWLIAAVVLIMAARVALLVWRGQRAAAWWLLVALSFAVVASQPQARHERVRIEPETLAIVLDRSASLAAAGTQAAARAAFDALKRQALAKGHPPLASEAAGTGQGTRLTPALDAALGQSDVRQLGAIVLLTDGQIDDGDALLARAQALGRPVHVLLAGNPNLIDRQLVLSSAPAFAVTGATARLELTLVSAGGDTGPARVRWTVDGVVQPDRTIRPGERLSLDVPVGRRGRIDIAATVDAAVGERHLHNNAVAATINGIREGLSVLLVSGVPHLGERLWRDVLKSDPSVALVHFTILRYPWSADPTPVSELALIPFPVDQLFGPRLSQFDLVIFDRFAMLSLLDPRYFDNLAAFVTGGGAILVVAGPEQLEAESLSRTALGPLLPVEPRRLIDQAFRPQLTALGERHPVTATLKQDQPSVWGRWDRMLAGNMRQGQTLMAGPGGAPLLIVDEVGQGRIGMLLSDRIWYWARGIDGGGPREALLRRTAHWLMKEPELEAEQLDVTASTAAQLQITRRSLSPEPLTVTVTAPDGSVESRQVAPGAAGISQIPTPAPGLYKVSAGPATRWVLAGLDRSREVQAIRPVPGPLAEVARITGGSIGWLGDTLPSLRPVDAGAPASGAGWIGLRRSDARQLLASGQVALLPPVVAMGMLVLSCLLAWLAQSGQLRWPAHGKRPGGNGAPIE